MHQTRFYRHYKNMPYKLLGLVRHSETQEELALYETLYENKSGKLWVRPKDMFFEKIEKDGKMIYRFAPISFEIKEFTEVGPKQIEEIKSIGKKVFSQFLGKEFKEKLQQHSGVLLLIAYDGDMPVGFKIGYQESKEDFYSWLGGVLPSHQGLGVASVLMEKQEQWCLNNGFKKITTKSENQFQSMIRLNLKNGFQIVGTEKKENKNLKVLFEKAIKA